MINPKKFIRQNIASMKPYTPILPFEVLSQKLGRPPEEIIKLDANENPYGASPKAIEAVQTGLFFHIYPDPESRQLRQTISDYTQLPVEYLLAGMGADELIDLVCRAVLDRGDGVIDCPPSFGMYPFSTAVNDGSYISIPRSDTFEVDLAGIETAVTRHPQAKILFLCSPNNPNGSLIDDDSLHRLLTLPILVVLDEAYIDFAAHPGHLDWVPRYDNLVVLRTFSKLAGLAGLRVGYGAFPPWLLSQLWKIKQPYNVSVAASLAAAAALQDVDWLRESTGKIRAERDRLFSLLKQHPSITPFPSQSNFILCRIRPFGTIDSAKSLKIALEKQGILVRYFDKPRLKNCIRISVGRPTDSDKLMAAIESLA